MENRINNEEIKRIKGQLAIQKKYILLYTTLRANPTQWSPLGGAKSDPTNES